MIAKRILAVDPGATTGWAQFSSYEEKPIRVGEVRKEVIYGWLEEFKGAVDIWVVEDYIIRPPKAQKGFEHFWDKGHTLRLIGSMEYRAYIDNCKFILQQPSIKPMAYKMMGQEYKKGKQKMHIPDAIAHGVHFIRKYNAELRRSESNGNTKKA